MVLLIAFQRSQDHYFQPQSKSDYKKRNLQGEKFVFCNEEYEPKNVASGIYDGVKGLFLLIKGGAVEIWKGVSGLVTKPYYRTKQQGVKGFFKVWK